MAGIGMTTYQRWFYVETERTKVRYQLDHLYENHLALRNFAGEDADIVTPDQMRKAYQREYDMYTAAGKTLAAQLGYKFPRKEWRNPPKRMTP